MSNTDFILTFVQSCAVGKLGLSDCGPVWQLGVIAALLVAAVITLLMLRVRARSQADNA